MNNKCLPIVCGTNNHPGASRRNRSRRPWNGRNGVRRNLPNGSNTRRRNSWNGYRLRSHFRRGRQRSFCDFCNNDGEIVYFLNWFIHYDIKLSRDL